MKTKGSIRAASFLLSFLLILSALLLPAGAERERPRLTVSGAPFGVRFFTDGVLVVEYCDVEHNGKMQNPARSAGICPGDCICGVNGAPVHTAAELSEAIVKNGAGPLSLSYKREGVQGEVTLSPLSCDKDGRLRTGLLVRDSGAGIGTVTFITAENTFGGLGHGICDGESGKLIPLARGSVMGVSIGSLKRGAAGAPGELKGHFSGGKTGALLQNTPCGVFGLLTDRPACPAGDMPIAFRDEVHDGAVTLWCTVDEDTPREYGAEIHTIHRNAPGNKCFTVHITDRALLDKTGGIVQGMSGSPIIQDGKLVGAVTHVLIGDPTTGYGIFIENMLNAAQMPEARAS
jgi:stage IV sporulation protein B